MEKLMELARKALYRIDGPIASDDGMIIENALTMWEQEREQLIALQQQHKQTLELLRWFIERTAIDHSYTHTPEYAEALQLVKGGSDNVHG